MNYFMTMDLGIVVSGDCVLNMKYCLSVQEITCGAE